MAATFGGGIDDDGETRWRLLSCTEQKSNRCPVSAYCVKAKRQFVERCVRVNESENENENEEFEYGVDICCVRKKNDNNTNNGVEEIDICT